MSLSTGTLATPRTVNLKSRAKSWVFWVVGILVVTAAATFFLWPAKYDEFPLDPANSGTEGTMALVEVLKQQGVQVTVVHSADELERLNVPPQGTTLVVTDPRYGGLPRLTVMDEYPTVVVFGTTSSIDDLGVSQTYLYNTTPGARVLQANCPITVGKAVTLSVQAQYALRPNSDTTGVQTCFPDGSGFQFVRLQRAATTYDVVADPGISTNVGILDGDNAAFSLALLGRHSRLVWLSVNPDLAPQNRQVFADPIQTLLPWGYPVIGLLIWTAIVAVLWAGRRLGRLVIEPLPVVVKAVETTHSRGRLYHKASAHHHALAILQRATARRLTARLALPDGTSTQALAQAVADTTGRTPRDVWDLLYAQSTGTDDFSRRAKALLTLEQEVRPQ